jgi:hypothetical protein
MDKEEAIMKHNLGLRNNAGGETPARILSFPVLGNVLREPRTRYRSNNVFGRIESLQRRALRKTVVAQLDRLRELAELMQKAEQGALPGEMLRVYGWEVSDIAARLNDCLREFDGSD